MDMPVDDRISSRIARSSGYLGRLGSFFLPHRDYMLGIYKGKFISLTDKRACSGPLQESWAFLPIPDSDFTPSIASHGKYFSSSLFNITPPYEVGS